MPSPSAVDHTLLIQAAPARVLDAFFDPDALSTWWQTTRSVTAPRPLGIYAVEWEATEDRDDLLGRLGGTFYGVVMDYKPGQELFVADAFWLPPDGEPIGPMSLEVRCTMEGSACRLRVRQGGFEDAPRWQRYLGIVSRGWQTSLEALKEYAEQP